MNQQWIRSSTSESCPTCRDLADQVHPAETWGAHNVAPKAECLYCGDACHCQLVATDKAESGNLSTVRYKRTPEHLSEEIGPAPLALDSVSGLMSNPEQNYVRGKPVNHQEHSPMPAKPTIPDFFSTPILAELADLSANLPKGKTRAEVLNMIESGELESIEFDAKVYRHVRNTNYYTFPAESLADFAASFAGQPFLRDHATYLIEARDGTILTSRLDGDLFIQRISLTTRRGMTSYVEGQIDRFSVGWYYDEILCSICNQSFWSLDCNHRIGKKYKLTDGAEATCQLVFTNPKGKETSAVNAPGVVGETGILAALETLKGDPMKFKPALYHDKDEGGGTPTTPTAPTTPEAALQRNNEAMRAFLGEAERQAQLAEQIKQSDALLVQQAGFVLKSALDASRLPAVTQERIRKQYTGKTFDPAQLQETIDDARAEISAIQGGMTVQGPGRTGSFITGLDEFKAALDDLFGAPREPGMEGKKVHRLRGIQEAYLLGTGDIDFYGNFDPTHALQAMLGTTATFPGIVKDSLNKILVNKWSEYGKTDYGWWKNIVTEEHFTNLNEVDWVQTGTIGSLPVVAEQGEYTELPIGDNVETSAWYKYGGYIGLTLEAILRDDIRAFKRMPDEAALGGMRNISEQVAAIFTQASGAGPTLADTGALFNATAVTTAGGHANLLTTALGTDYTAWKAVSNAMYKQAMLIKNAAGYYGTGKRQGIRPKYCLVPADLWDQACDLFVTRQNSLDNKNVENRYFGSVYPVGVPEWTDATDWAAVIDPKLVPGVMIGEIFGLMPQIFVAGNEMNGAMFANDESRIKVRQFLVVGVCDFRPLHKSNVAG